MKRAQRSALRLLQVMLVSSIALPAVLFGFASWVNFRTVSENVDERLHRTLDVLNEHAERVLLSIELALRVTADITSKLPDEAIRDAEAEVAARLQRILSSLARGQSLWLFDKAGQPLVTTAITPVPRWINNTDRDYFQAQLTSGAGTYIGRPVAPRIGQKPIFTVSHRRSTETGDFDGVIAAAVSVDEFSTFYGEIGRAPGAYMALIRNDGVFLARHPITQQDRPVLDENSTLLRALQNAPEAGEFNAASQLDSIERRIVYRKLPNYPLYVLAGAERSAIWHEWWAITARQLLFGLPLTALLFSALALALQRTKRLHAEAQGRLNAEDALRHSQKMEALGQLTGGVAHDFNNLLMVVEGNLSRAAREISSEKGRRALESVNTAIERAKGLTRRLLSFSRQGPLEVRDIDLPEHLRGLREMLDRSLPGTIAVRVRVPAEPCCIKVDPAELDVAVLNLAVNARDAMPAGGILEIGCRQHCMREHAVLPPGNYIELFVTDTGSGISPENLPRIFEPFFTTKQVGQGTGLGLSQVYGFARQSGGLVSVDSTPGRGTTVSLLLPETQGVPALKLASAQLKEVVGEGLLVLVVDDNPEVADVVSAMLVDLGCTVTRASSAAEAKASLLTTSPDLVLSDIVMPGPLDGIGLASHIREHHPAVQVILATGYSDRVCDAAKLGIRVIQKPFNSEALAGVMRSIGAARSQAKLAGS